MRNILTAVLMVFMAGPAFSGEIAKTRAVNAIIGEAEGEGFDGMLAIACCIRSRGTLRGVYGERAPRVVKHQYSTKTFVAAVRAWEDSRVPRNCGMIKGATGWGNAADVEAFKQTKWFKKCKTVAQVGRHYFYK